MLVNNHLIHSALTNSVSSNILTKTVPLPVSTGFFLSETQSIERFWPCFESVDFHIGYISNVTCLSFIDYFGVDIRIRDYQ